MQIWSNGGMLISRLHVGMFKCWDLTKKRKDVGWCYEFRNVHLRHCMYSTRLWLCGGKLIRRVSFVVGLGIFPKKVGKRGFKRPVIGNHTRFRVTAAQGMFQRGEGWKFVSAWDVMQILGQGCVSAGKR